MRFDEHANPMSGTTEAVAAYDTAIDDLLAYRPAVLDHLETFATDHADVPMSLAFSAYLQLTSTDPRDLPGARRALDAMAVLTCNEREAMHRSAIAAWQRGDWHGASAHLDELLVRWPCDLLALLVGHQLDFFLGDAANLRDRVGRSLGAIDRGHHHRGFALGMHAFGLEESGQYPAAEDAGLAALAIHADDVWARHAVAHVHEMQGRVDDGIAFLGASEADWGSGNLFTVHLWWHLALFLLEQERIDELLAIYDREVHHGDSMGVPIEMLDASALLWRLHLDGIDVGGRFEPLADAWTATHTEAPWYVFNDLHAVMALVGAGRVREARERLDVVVHEHEAGTGGRSNHDATAVAGLPAMHAVLAFAEGRYGEAVERLLPARRTLHAFGGSHAQRDAMQRTLVEAAIRAGRHDLAAALLRERLSARPAGAFALSRMGRLASQTAEEATRDDPGGDPRDDPRDERV